MIKYIVIKDGIEINTWTSDFAGPDYYEPNFGKQERWVRDSDYSPLTQEEKDSALNTREIVDELTELLCTEYLLPAEYEIISEDLGNSLEMTILRNERNNKLAECDWTQLADSSLTQEQKADWAAYRQKLRDLPGETEDPLNPVWPEFPTLS